MTMPYTGPDPAQPTGGYPPGGVTIINPPAPPPAPGLISPELRAIFDAELNAERERVRQEEKSKLYPEIDRLKGEVGVLTQERTDRIAAEETAQQAAAEAERLRQEAEMTANDRIAQVQSETQRRFAEIEQDRARERALWDKENEYRALEDYKARLRLENADNIVPQFIDFISGNSKEQIDASVVDLIARSEALTAQIQHDMGLAQQQQRRSVGMPVTGGPPVDMARMGEEGTRSFTDAELRAMPMEEYSALRPQLQAAMRQHVSERGIYG